MISGDLDVQFVEAVKYAVEGSRCGAFERYQLAGKRFISTFRSTDRMHQVPSGASGKSTFADEHKRYTRTFERLVLDLSKHMTIKAVSHHLGVSWDLIKGIQKAT